MKRLEVYYTDDILNALLAAEQATGAALRAAGKEDDYAEGYQAGYRSALVTVGLSFGLVQQGQLRELDSGKD